jgi:hypothetical protein
LKLGSRRSFAGQQKFRIAFGQYVKALPCQQPIKSPKQMLVILIGKYPTEDLLY